MPRMIELIRQSAVPVNIMRAASRGALSLPAVEMVEILVALSTHPMFGQQAQMTLAGWDEESAKLIAADPQTPIEILKYLSSPRNLRPRLLPALIENPAIPESRLAKIAALKSREIAEAMLASPRAMQAPEILRALLSTEKLTAAEINHVNSALEGSPETTAAEDFDEDILNLEMDKYLKEHADEIHASEGQPFFLHGFTLDEERELLPTLSASEGSTASAGAKAMAFAAKVDAARAKGEKESTIQKIMKLSVGERVQLAMKGNKDERFILVRDGARVVCNAVIESPKLSDSEVEAYAAMKNVQESVLRTIASKRKFIKNYAVIRTLTANPRCPMDVTLPLLPHLLTMDLKNLSMNKNVADTVRKIAFKMFKDRSTKK